MGLGERGLGPCLSGPPPPMSQGVIQGTVPYLGTFLTDLVMLDTAMKDYLYVSAPRGWAGLAAQVSICPTEVENVFLGFKTSPKLRAPAPWETLEMQQEEH